MAFLHFPLLEQVAKFVASIIIMGEKSSSRKRRREKRINAFQSVNRTHLHPSLGQIQSHRELFPGEHVWILSVPERLLELVQLVRGERGTGSSNLAWPIRLSQIQSIRLAQVQRIVKGIVHLMVAQVTEFRVSGITDRIGRRRVIWEQQRSVIHLNSVDSNRFECFSSPSPLPSIFHFHSSPWSTVIIAEIIIVYQPTINRSNRKAWVETRHEMTVLTMCTDIDVARDKRRTRKTGAERMVLKGCGRSIEARIEYAYQTIAWTFDTWTKERIGAIKLNRPRCQNEIDVPLIWRGRGLEGRRGAARKAGARGRVGRGRRKGWRCCGAGVGAISFLSRATTGADIYARYTAIMSDRRICQF